MTTTPPRPDGTRDDRSSDQSGNSRRRLILGGLPLAVTLASRPALAATGQCSVSHVLSGNLSNPLPSGTNCGLTPLTWCNLAGTNQLWPRTGYSSTTRFLSAFGSLPLNSKWTCSNPSLLSAMQNSLSVQCKIGSNLVTLSAGNFGAQVCAGLLNACAFAPTNYSLTSSEVTALVSPIWTSSPSSQSAAQSLLDAVTSQLSALNVNT
jgi:hypothetical protein